MKFVAHRAVPRWLPEWCIRRTRSVKRGWLVGALAVWAVPSGATTLSVEVVPLDRTVTALESTSRGSFDGPGAYMFASDTAYLAAPCPGEPGGWCVEETEPTPVANEPRLPAARDVPTVTPLSDGRWVARADATGTVDAWLVEPTTRYAHGVLGDAVEAGALACAHTATAGGAWNVRYVRPPTDGVFEDRSPRLADLDGDGAVEIVTVMSELGAGASLVVYGVRTAPPAEAAIAAEAEGGSETVTTLFLDCPLLARTPPIGTSNRWLNPAAIYDFDGDGVLDVALVETPHIGGELQLWSGVSLLAGEPVLLAVRRGYSNHTIGSRALDMSAVIRTNDGDRLVLPSADRRALIAVAYEGDEWTERGRVDLPSRAATNIAPVGRDLAVGLEDGRLIRVVVDRTP